MSGCWSGPASRGEPSHEQERSDHSLLGNARLDPDARDLVEAITEGVVNKLLHEPTVRVKDAAGTPRGDYYADALATLFDLQSPEQREA